MTLASPYLPIWKQCRKQMKERSMTEGCGITQEEIDQNIVIETRNRINRIISGCRTRGMSSEATTDEVWEYLNLNMGGLAPRALKPEKRLAESPATWQSIDTAPKDGTRFLAGHYRVRISQPNYFEWYVCVYAGECKIPTDDEEWGVAGNDGEFYCPEGFYREAQDKYGDEQYMVAKPTHWMPVPKINDNNLESR